MNSEIIDYFEVHRSIFGNCPKCNKLFRLSECKVFLKTIPEPDWMDELEKKSDSLDRLEDRIAEKEEEIREEARERGRKQAQRSVCKVDPIFRPIKLNPDDAKVIFHPVDYVVFDGMKICKHTRRIVLLDKETKDSQQKTMQRSIERTIEKGKIDWETLLIKEDGTITKNGF